MLSKQETERRECIEKLNRENDTHTTQKENTKYICDVMSRVFQPAYENGNIILGDELLHDVEMFDDFNYETGQSVFVKLDKTTLVGGSYLLKQIVSTPIFDVQILEKRVALLKELQKNESFKKIGTHLNTIKAFEKDVFWLYSIRDQEELQTLLQMVYFKSWVFKTLNSSNMALYSYNIHRIIISPLIGILSPLIYIILPYLIIRLKFGFNMGIVTYIRLMVEMLSSFEFNTAGALRLVYMLFTIIFYFQGLFTSFEVSRSCYKVSSIITSKIGSVKSFQEGVDSMKKLYPIDKLIEFLPLKMSVPNSITQQNATSNQCPLNFSLFKNFGESLRCYNTIGNKDGKLDNIDHMFAESWIYDTMLSIITLVENPGYCFPSYIPSNVSNVQVKLDVVGIWHPFLNHSTVVKNDIELGYNNMLLTGPNAGGKSTVLKAVLLTALMSQTICIAPAHSVIMTPFAYINSQINVPDSKGHASLFQAEMFRVKRQFDVLKRKEYIGKPCLLICDEMFSSTNPVEGIAGSYAIATYMAKLTNLISVISTHYIYLTKLQKKCKRFKNYKVEVVIDANTITYPYVLLPGVSRQYVALELMKQHGFDPELMDLAISIKNKLTCI